MSALVALAGCGKQEFKVVTITTPQAAPGTYTIPPKIDLLLAEDDSGSISEVYDAIARQIPIFLSDLQNRGWDYHFAITPLTRARALNQILAARYDVNWGTDWIAPYPGALPTNDGMINPNFFKRPEQYTHFLSRSDVNNDLNGLEPGLENIYQALLTRTAGTGFLRNDALLVILAIGNGEDTSGYQLCNRGDGYLVPCSLTEFNNSLVTYRTQFAALKTNPAQVKFYAAVSTLARNSCLGGGARAGTRYMDMASNLGGTAQDICTQPVSGILSSIANHLQVQRQNFRTRYLLIEREPDPATIQVVRYVGGDTSQAVEIPKDSVNGWSYAGYLSNIYVIDSPVPMNQASGYTIELHGSAKLVGNDSAAVLYKPAGARDSSR